MKYILLTGVEFNNQGAYLMLRAMADQVRNRFNAVPVVGFGNGSMSQKMLAGVASLVPFDPYWRSGRIGKERVLSGLKSRVPLVFPAEISAIFDGSGFAFADQWADRDLDRRADFFEFWKKHDRPVYLLPQAFGPFELTGGPVRRVLDAADLVFARDERSFEYVSGLGVDNKKLQMFPDFTSGISVASVSYDETLRNCVPIIPNWNIYERASSDDEREKYLSNLEGLISAITEAGDQPYGLSHEGAKDLEILNLVSERLGGRLRIISGLNGVELKRLIGVSKYVVSGRFHAIVSALSAGVPAVIHGWSHKYQYIADDYAAGSLVVNPLGSLDENLKCLDDIVKNSHSLRASIQAAGPDQKRRVDVMWDLIEADLRGRW